MQLCFWPMDVALMNEFTFSWAEWVTVSCNKRPEVFENVFHWEKECQITINALIWSIGKVEDAWYITREDSDVILLDILMNMLENFITCPVSTSSFPPIVICKLWPQAKKPGSQTKIRLG